MRYVRDPIILTSRTDNQQYSCLLFGNDACIRCSAHSGSDLNSTRRAFVRSRAFCSVAIDKVLEAVICVTRNLELLVKVRMSQIHNEHGTQYTPWSPDRLALIFTQPANCGVIEK